MGKVVTVIFENQIYFESLELRMQNFPDDQFLYYLIKLQIKPSTQTMFQGVAANDGLGSSTKHNGLDRMLLCYKGVSGCLSNFIMT